MHSEILTKEQRKLLPVVKNFARDFGLVGGTAVALHLGHRRSLDFDLFSNKEFGNISIQNALKKLVKIDSVLVSRLGEYTLVIHGVKFTFFHYPFVIAYPQRFEGIRLPDLLTLAAMKVFALGQRAKWKDYVDLYFLLTRCLSLPEIVGKAKELFGEMFGEKLIREQLAYFDDVDYSEKVEYLPGFEVSDQIVRDELVRLSVQ